MTSTVTGMFSSRDEALRAVDALRDAEIPDADISVVSNNANGDVTDERASDAAEDAGKGAGIGAVLGGTGGLLTGLGIMAIPGVGPVVAAGWLVATAAGAAAGAVVGGAAGGLIGAMTEHGVPERDAHVYAEGVRRGGSLVVARVEDGRESTARAILGKTSYDIGAREKAYRAEGWNGFDDQAVPFTREQVAAERDRYPLV